MVCMIWPNLSTALLACSAIGLVSAFLAHKRGRNPYSWFFIGFAFGLFGVLAIFFPSLTRKSKAPAPAPQPFIHGPTDKPWYYLDSAHEQHGPFSHNALTRFWKEGKIAPSHYVWHEELKDWKPLQDFIKTKK